MQEVFRRIIVVIMASAGLAAGLYSLIWGGALLLAGVGLTPYSATLSGSEQVQHALGGLAVAVIPNAVIVYIALGYFKKH